MNFAGENKSREIEGYSFVSAIDSMGNDNNTWR
jgi:hypothetical protein